MSILLPFNGQNYIIPTTGEVGWGSNLDDYLVAISAGALQKTGGSFTLSAELDFGGSYGLKSLYYKSRSTNPASVGPIRLANLDEINWRNSTNTGNLPLTVSGSDQLTFNGVQIITASGGVINATQIANGTIDNTEFQRLNGVTSDIQTQLNDKVNDTGDTITGTLTINPAINQLILGGVGAGTTITITAPAPVANRILTIPDPGLDASFVMAAGNQNIAGQKTFTNQIVASASGQFLSHSSASPSDSIMYLRNTNATSAGQVGIQLVQSDNSGGDPYIQFQVGTGPAYWTLGADNSDSDSFKISHSSVLGTADDLVITPSGAMTITGPLTVTNGVTNLFNYRRPNLVYSSVTAIEVENNTGTLNQTTIVFPDGTNRSVVEDVSLTNKYRKFLITSTAEFLTGTEDSGLYSGLSETANTWYAIYAVKSQINSANFVLVGDTTLPLQSNYSTLNTQYGTNGWIYLGMIRNGNNDAVTSDIMQFYQSAGVTQFADITSYVRLSSTPDWTYSGGTGAAQIPDFINLAYIRYSVTVPGANQANIGVGSLGGNFLPYFRKNMVAGEFNLVTLLVPVKRSLKVMVVSPGSETVVMNLLGWVDPIVVTGINPVI